PRSPAGHSFAGLAPTQTGAEPPDDAVEIHEAALEEEDGSDQHAADDEFPEEGTDLRGVVLDHEIDRRPDEGAIEAAHAAEDQDPRAAPGGGEPHRRRAAEAGRRGGGGARRSGHRGGDGIDGEEPPPDRRADRTHAPRVLADAVERAAEGRMNQPPG